MTEELQQQDKESPAPPSLDDLNIAGCKGLLDALDCWLGQERSKVVGVAHELLVRVARRHQYLVKKAQEEAPSVAQPQSPPESSP